MSENLKLCAHLVEPPTGCRCGYKGGIWTSDGGEMVCEMGVHKCQGSEMIPVPDGATLRAYACLFAAAPKMLTVLVEVEAIMSIVEPRSYKHGYLASLDRVRRAIAEANGGLAKSQVLAE